MEIRSHRAFIGSKWRLLILACGLSGCIAQSPSTLSSNDNDLALDLSGYSRKRVAKFSENFLIADMPTKKSEMFKDKQRNALIIHYTDIEVPESGDDLFVWKRVNKHIANSNSTFRESGFYQPNRKPIYYVKLSSIGYRYPHQLFFFTVQDGKLIYGTYNIMETDYKKWNAESTQFIASLRFRIQPI